MPIYEYECGCGHTEERLGCFADLPPSHCETRMTRLVSAPGRILFMGLGFYATEYGKQGYNLNTAERKIRVNRELRNRGFPIIQENYMFKESTTQLLRAEQVTDLTDMKNQLENTLHGPAYITNQIQDIGALRTRLRNTVQMLENQAPTAYQPEMVDEAVSREKELRESALVGMPTDAEMRRNPSGAVDKHRQWEKLHKNEILEWKNIRRRLHAGGQVDGLGDATDVANFELFRPQGGPQELNMHGEQIQGQEFFMDHSPRSVTMSDQEITTLQAIDPDLAGQLATLSPEIRKGIKDFIATMDADTKPDICGVIGQNEKPCGRETEGGPCWQHKETQDG